MSTTPTHAKRCRQGRTASKPKVPLPPQLQRVNLNAAGINIGSEEHWAAVRSAPIANGRMMTAPDDNSGVFVAFPHPEQQNYDNTAYVGINFGFEIQIDELARPDNAPIHRTGAIYSFKGPTDGPLVVHPVGEWNNYEITVDGADLTVALNGQVVNRFHFTGDPQSPQRGLPSTPQKPRFIGLQTHTGSVLFRRIQWKAL